MKEFAIENIDDALDIVSGDKLHCYKFDSLMESGEYDEETLKMMTSKLTANCENKLEILSPENLDTLYNTFVDKQDDKDYYKVAFNKVTEAIDNVIKKFNAGDAKIGGGDIAYLEALIEKRTKDAEKAGADKNDYDEAKKNLAEFAKEYDEKYNLNDFNENTIELMDNNFEKMHSYQQDDESSNVPYESHIVKIKPENFSDFLAKKINNKDDVTYSDCASVILSFRGKDWLDVKGNLFKRITEKINKKQPIEGEDLAGANAILKILSNKVEDIKEYTGEKKKLLELKKELTKQIDQSTKFALHNQVVKDIEQLVINNIEITKDRGLFWNKKISQKKQCGILQCFFVHHTLICLQ